MRFVISRFLRLFPMFWFAAALSFLLIWLLGENRSSQFHGALYLPDTINSALSNLTMVFVAWKPISVTPNLIPPAWAITIELFFYTCICLGISKTPKRVMVWLVMSVCYVLISFYANLPWQDRYYPIVAASLPFSIGAAVYFLKDNPRVVGLVKRFKFFSLVCFSFLIANCALWVWLSRYDIKTYAEIGFYINLLLCAALVMGVACGKEIHSLDHKVDQFIGNFSYPIYLFHMPIGLLLFAVSGAKHTYWSPVGSVQFIASLVLVFGLSFIAIRYIDRPIQRRRKILKNGSIESTAT